MCSKHDTSCDCTDNTDELLACRFGEDLDGEVLSKAFSALESCDLFVTIGTSSVVYPAAGFAAKVHSINHLLRPVPSSICSPVSLSVHL